MRDLLATTLEATTGLGVIVLPDDRCFRLRNTDVVEAFIAALNSGIASTRIAIGLSIDPRASRRRNELMLSTSPRGHRFAAIVSSDDPLLERTRVDAGHASYHDELHALATPLIAMLHDRLEQHLVNERSISALAEECARDLFLLPLRLRDLGRRSPADAALVAMELQRDWRAIAPTTLRPLAAQLDLLLDNEPESRPLPERIAFDRAASTQLSLLRLQRVLQLYHQRRSA